MPEASETRGFDTLRVPACLIPSPTGSASPSPSARRPEVGHGKQRVEESQEGNAPPSDRRGLVHQASGTQVVSRLV